MNVAYSIAPSQAAVLKARETQVAAKPMPANSLSNKKRKKGKQQVMEPEQQSSLEDPRFLDDLDAVLDFVQRTRPSHNLV